MKTSKDNPLDKQGFGLIIGLSLQYILGITITIFVKFPENLSKGQSWIFAWKQIPLAIHIILGIFLLLGSIVLFIRAIKVSQKKWIVASTVGLAAILASILSGASFIERQSDTYSYIMALSFIIALLAYIWGLYSSKTT